MPRNGGAAPSDKRGAARRLVALAALRSSTPRIRAEQVAGEPRPIADVAAELLERLLYRLLRRQPDDAARKALVMDLRARGALSEDFTQLAFYWFPGLRHA